MYDFLRYYWPCWGAFLAVAVVGSLTTPMFLEAFFLTREQIVEYATIISTYQWISAATCTVVGLILARMWQRRNEINSNGSD
ncbi:hypothetical protein [uncultured Tateyamaria sp.]|uniref:hypothetical protein n=1 Tax=uncultured Tateyamaria sp. TaxID=455651 RepID=UPI002635C3E3|nr:hypothetical protein [uncultured Tateyamaria sp.]